MCTFSRTEGDKQNFDILMSQELGKMSVSLWCVCMCIVVIHDSWRGVVVSGKTYCAVLLTLPSSTLILHFKQCHVLFFHFDGS